MIGALSQCPAAVMSTKLARGSPGVRATVPTFSPPRILEAIPLTTFPLGKITKVYIESAGTRKASPDERHHINVRMRDPVKLISPSAHLGRVEVGAGISPSAN